MGKYNGAKDNSFHSSTRQIRSNSRNETDILEQNDHTSFTATNLIYTGNNHKDRSADIFRTNRIETCNYVKRVGSEFVAIPFYKKAQRTFADSMTTSVINKSTNKDTYQQRNLLHVGMQGKPLTRYEPEAQRSRLPPVDIRQYYVNRSVIEIGDRQSVDTKQWMTTTQNDFRQNQYTQRLIPTKHPGIAAFRTRWNHNLKRK